MLGNFGVYKELFKGLKDFQAFNVKVEDKLYPVGDVKVTSEHGVVLELDAGPDSVANSEDKCLSRIMVEEALRTKQVMVGSESLRGVGKTSAIVKYVKERKNKDLMVLIIVGGRYRQDVLSTQLYGPCESATKINRGLLNCRVLTVKQAIKGYIIGEDSEVVLDDVAYEDYKVILQMLNGDRAKYDIRGFVTK